ncbi:MAG: tellurite resistance TerB family protein [Myxococcales bacterium]|nr:tellurite resistance TerB family protein [Polyangiaceae bacterium]MDW8251876.1 tellurite resistance TerB family protein [Myxococcales bacterium]
MEPPPSLLRARDILAYNASPDLPHLSQLSPSGPDGGGQSNRLYHALLEAAFLVAAADGELTREEIGELADLIAQMTGQMVSPRELADSLIAYSEQLEQTGRAARIEALASACTDVGERRQILGFAALVALCDQEIAPAELFVLHSLGRAFRLHVLEVNDIVRTIRLELNQRTSS